MCLSLAFLPLENIINNIYLNAFFAVRAARFFFGGGEGEQTFLKFYCILYLFIFFVVQMRTIIPSSLTSANFFATWLLTQWKLKHPYNSNRNTNVKSTSILPNKNINWSKYYRLIKQTFSLIYVINILSRCSFCFNVSSFVLSLHCLPFSLSNFLLPYLVLIDLEYIVFKPTMNFEQLWVCRLIHPGLHTSRWSHVKSVSPLTIVTAFNQGNLLTSSSSMSLVSEASLVTRPSALWTITQKNRNEHREERNSGKLTKYYSKARLVKWWSTNFFVKDLNTRFFWQITNIRNTTRLKVSQTSTDG